MKRLEKLHLTKCNVESNGGSRKSASKKPVKKECVQKKSPSKKSASIVFIAKSHFAENCINHN